MPPIALRKPQCCAAALVAFVIAVIQSVTLLVKGDTDAISTSEFVACVTPGKAKCDSVRVARVGVGVAVDGVVEDSPLVGT